MHLDFTRPLIFVAHPDDETIACAGLLQRVAASLVVFATDGAPPRYGFERKFGTLRNYSQLRFQEASRALSHVPNCSFRRLIRPGGIYFGDQHLFQYLPDAVRSLTEIAREFSPDALVSHTYEGGHIDHDACGFISMHASTALGVRRFEFPIYSMDDNGTLVYQQFRDVRPGTVDLRLTPAEIACKAKMAAEYQTQQGAFSVFDPGLERIRPAGGEGFTVPACSNYSYEARQLNAQRLLNKFTEFEALLRSDWRP